ncbi:MAG: dephospho-CoA kinase [Butyrivibrio sp.]|nr:dephospho-CoA kinase [Butyrivibrio sp.]
MNITLTGNLGSGKTSVCKILESQGFNIISTGSIFRSVASEKGISVTELNELCKTDKELDRTIDERSAKLGEELDNTVFDSRLAWHFVRKSFKVFLLVSQKEAARRVYAGSPRDAENYSTEREAREGLLERAMLERSRYADLYGLDYYSLSNYDLVIESTNATPEQIAEEIVRNFKAYQKAEFTGKLEMNPSSVYPSKAFSGFSVDIYEQYLKQEKQNKILCGLHKAAVVIKSGRMLLTDEGHSTFAAAKSGKAFVEIEIADSDTDAVQAVDESTLAEYEKVGGFRYALPSGEEKDYMFEFGNGGWM